MVAIDDDWVVVFWNLTEIFSIWKLKVASLDFYPTAGVVQGIKEDHFLIAPPFIITKEEIDTALDILEQALTEFERRRGM